MTDVYVRVRDLVALQLAVRRAGRQSMVARGADISPQRLHQLLTGKRATIGVDAAAALEDALHVRRGSLFGFPDAGLAAPYATEAGAA